MTDPAWEMVHEAILAFGMNVPDLGRARAALVRVINEEAWKHYVPPLGEPCEPPSFTAWVTAKIPRGLETSIKNLEAIAKGDDRLLSALEIALERKSGAPKGNSNAAKEKTTFDNIQGCSKAPTGTSESAALRRLHKERPDLLERVNAQELSAHAAMIQAGFRHPTATIRTDDPESIARTLRRRLDTWTLNNVLKLLTEDDAQ